jgi:hypothetical protein
VKCNLTCKIETTTTEAQSRRETLTATELVHCRRCSAKLQPGVTMQTNKVYDEVIEFIASSSPQNVIAFRPSEESKARVADLIFREKVEGLSEDEKSELDHYLQIEHLMRLAKARAHHYLTHD